MLFKKQASQKWKAVHLNSKKQHSKQMNLIAILIQRLSYSTKLKLIWEKFKEINLFNAFL
jgi:hypothetical protein